MKSNFMSLLKWWGCGVRASRNSIPLFIPCLFCVQMWACALGHLEAAVVLYKWDRRALAIPDSLGRLPLSIARSRGHTKLAECLEQLQREEQQPAAPLPPASRMSFSPAPDVPTSDSWMVTWASDGVVAPSGKKGGAATTSTSGTTNLNPGQNPPWHKIVDLLVASDPPKY